MQKQNCVVIYSPCTNWRDGEPATTCVLNTRGQQLTAWGSCQATPINVTEMLDTWVKTSHKHRPLCSQHSSVHVSESLSVISHTRRLLPSSLSS